MDVLDFWEKIKRLIKEQNLTQKEVADHCGILFGTWQNWLHRKTLPDIFQAHRIAETLGVSVEYLVGAKIPEREYGLLEAALTIAAVVDKLNEEGKKAALASIRGLQKAYSGEKISTGRSSREGVTEDPEGVFDFLKSEMTILPLFIKTAGKPIDFSIDSDRRLMFPIAMLDGDGENFVIIRVDDDSMAEDDIQPGEYVLIRKTEKVMQGRLMLVKHENSSILKRIDAGESSEFQIQGEFLRKIG